MTRRPHAFTLIELLIVVVIIIVLISVLVPALYKAKDYARTAACSSNLHQVGVAFTSYLSDASNVKIGDFPPGYNSTTGHNYASTLIDAGYLAAPQTNPGQGSTGSALRCPNGDDSPGNLGAVGTNPMPTAPGLNGYWENDVYATKSKAEHHYRTWYGYNGGTTGDAPLPDTNGTSLPLISRDKYSHDVTNLVLLFDGYLTANSSIQGASAIPYSARHSLGTATNVLCADGHAETVPVKQLPQGAFSSIAIGSPGLQWRLTQVQ